MPKKLVWQFSKDYVAGESIEDAVMAAKELNKQGISRQSMYLASL